MSKNGPKSEPAWVKDLIAEQLDALRAGLSLGKSPAAMAKVFREKYPELWPELEVKQIGSRFSQYKRKVLGPEQQKALMTVLKEKQADTRRNIDVATDMEEMIRLHRSRLELAMEAEALMGIRFEPINEEIERHMIMLERLAKLYLEIGVINRVPKKVTGSLSDLMGTTKVFEWTEEDSKRVAKTKLLEGVKYREVED